MRLICPNCGAQYEVDANVIPEQGRDVQCSNCGHTWFQPPAHMDVETAAELGEELAEAPENADVSEDESTVDPSEGLKRQELDPNIADVLREEAAREAEQRAADAEGLETQPDLGIDEAEKSAADRSAAARARMARLRGSEDTSDETEAAIAAAAASGSRKELLPDIEEINSSLRAGSDRSADIVEDLENEVEHATTQKAEKGGRWGFRLIVILALIAIAVYVFAGQIVELVPQTEPYLRQYVDFVRGLQAQIAPLMQQAVDWVQGLIGGGGA